jgi:phosphate-selective porin
MKHFIYLILFIFISSISTFAQKENEPVYDEFIKNFKKDYFTLEMLFQVVADFQPERTIIGNNGFSVSNMRLKMKGNLDENFGYFFQANFTSSPLLLDAVVKYKFSSHFMMEAGQFKVPISKEFLTFAGDIDFVNRSQVAEFLAPKRDIGFQLSGKFINDLLEYRAGIFNGSGANKLNNNNSFLFAGRISAKSKTETSSYEAGINTGYSENSDGKIISMNFKGKKIFAGGDFRAEIHNFLFSTEVIMNKLDGLIDSVQSTSEPFGYHITLGYKPFQNHQFLFRYDNLSPDGITSDSELYIIGYNFWPSKPTELQFNYIIDSKQTDFSNHWFLLNLQISL